MRWLRRTVGWGASRRVARHGSVGGLSTLRSTGSRRHPDYRHLLLAGPEASCRERRNYIACASLPHGAERGHRPLGLKGELGTEGPVREHGDQECSHRDSAEGYNPPDLLPHQECGAVWPMR